MRSRCEYTHEYEPHAVDVHDIVTDGGFCVQDDEIVRVCDGYCAGAVHKYRTLCCDDEDLARFEAKWIPLIIRAGLNNQLEYLKNAIPAADYLQKDTWYETQGKVLLRLNKDGSASASEYVHSEHHKRSFPAAGNVREATANDLCHGITVQATETEESHCMD